jgi:hypothetical protein
MSSAGRVTDDAPFVLPILRALLGIQRSQTAGGVVRLESPPVFFVL